MIEKYFPNRKFAAFLFDFDGTVVDTMPAHLKAWNESLKVYGLSLSAEQHQEWAGIPTRGILEMLSQRHGIELPVEDFLKQKEEHYFKNLPHLKEIVPVVHIIKGSFGKIPMAVVSGSRRNPIQKTLEQLNLTKYFDVIVAAEDYKNGKPAPDCFLQAARALKVEPKDCLAFEDAELGIQSAHAAGMACLKVVSANDAGHDLILSTPTTR